MSSYRAMPGTENLSRMDMNEPRSSTPNALVLAIVLFFGVVSWWISIRPSHDRNWRPGVAVMPRATINGDHVHLTRVRNFQYRSRNDFTVGYQERDVLLSHLVALDFYVSWWQITTWCE